MKYDVPRLLSVFLRDLDFDFFVAVRKYFNFADFSKAL